MPWFWTDELAQSLSSSGIDQGLLEPLVRNPIAIRIEFADSESEGDSASDDEVPLAA